MKKKDAPLFLFSFVLTLVTWLYVGSLFDPAKSKEFNVPLTIDARPGYVAVYPTETVTVVVTGSSTSMDRLRPQDLRAVANATSIDDGSIDANITVTGPKDLDLTYSPKTARVRLNLEKEARKPFAVEFERPGPDGVVAQTVPAKVIVRGPASVVERVARAVVGYDLGKDHAEQPSEWKVRLLAKDGEPVTTLTVEPDMVQIDANALAMAPRSLVVSPVTSGQPAAGFRVANISVKPSLLKAQIPPALAASISSLSTSPILLDGARADVVTKVSVLTPDGIKVVGDSTVDVTVKIVPEGAPPRSGQ